MVDFQTPRLVAAPGVLGNDYGNSSLIAVLSGPPIGGTVDLAPSGGFTFAPAAGFCGAASFPYQAMDGAIASNEGTVSLLIDCTPVANVDATTVLEDSGPSTITVLSNDTDPDPDETLTITGVTQGAGANGTVAVAGLGKWITYAPHADFFGTDSFTYAITDGRGGVASTTVTVTVTAVNDVPVFTTGANQTVLEDAGTQSVGNWATGRRAGPANETGQALSFTVDNSNNGLFAAAGQPALASDGTLTFTPAADAHGSATVTVQLRDDGGTADQGIDTSAPQTFVVDVTAVNDAPIAIDGSVSTGEDTAVTGILEAGDRDLDGLTFRIVASGGRGTATITDAATGAFSYAPGANANGTDTVTFTVNDGTVDSNVATMAVTITAVNDAAVVGNGTLTTAEDTAAAGSLTASDIEGDALTYSIVANGSKGSAAITDAATGAFIYTPDANANGTDTVTFLAHDGDVDSNLATLTVTIDAVNDVPGFAAGADQTVAEDAGARMVANWATGISAGPGDSGQAVSFTTSNGNTALFAVQPAVAADGTLSYTPAPNANGSATVTVRLQDDGGLLHGGVDTSAAQTFAITVAAVNDAPAFAKGPNQAVFGLAGPQTVANWATGLDAGAADESGQTLTFVVSNSHGALFATQPAVSPDGTLTYAPLANVSGTATVTVQLQDNGGGTNTSASQTFTIAVNKASTTTALTSSNSPSLFGVPVTFTATVGVVAPGAGPAAGAVIFKDGTTTITCEPSGSSLVAPVATCKTKALAVGTHSITAAYAGSGSFLGSMAPAVSQVISPSAVLSVQFIIHALQDNTSRPRVREMPVTDAEVRVYRKRDACANGLIVTGQARIWGKVFDGLDGYNAPAFNGQADTDPGCAVVTVGNYRAVGITGADGRVNIIVPPATTHPDTDYIVIGRTLDYDDVQTPAPIDPLYSEKTLETVRVGTAKQVLLHQIRLFNGKQVPGRDLEELGSYLAIIEPEYLDWTSGQEQYPFIFISDGDWGITTSVAPPDGFVPDYPTLSTSVTDSIVNVAPPVEGFVAEYPVLTPTDEGTTAVQFTLTDIGSDWTETGVTHVITHKGGMRIRTSAVPMFDRKSKAEQDAHARGHKPGFLTPLTSRFLAPMLTHLP
jgi:hypothetical protein